MAHLDYIIEQLGVRKHLQNALKVKLGEKIGSWPPVHILRQPTHIISEADSNNNHEIHDANRV